MPRKKTDDDVLVAIRDGAVDINGVPNFIKGNITRARRGSSIVKAAPQLFKEIDAHYEIEEMTAAPGEKRGAA